MWYNTPFGLMDTDPEQLAGWGVTDQSTPVPIYYECRGQGKMVLRGVDTHLRLKPPSRPMRV